MAVTELQIAAGVVSAFVFALMAFAIRVMYPKKTSDVDQSLEAMINGFDFELPEEVEMYRAFKEEHTDDVDACFNMLFRRAVADIPLIRKIQSESSGIQRLKKNDILKDGSFMSYKYAEELINEEINDVRREAEELKPGEGWPDKIFPQAVQFLNHMAEQQMNAQRKAAEEQMQAQMQAQGITPEQLAAAQQEAEAEAAAAAAPAEAEEGTEEGDEGLRKRK
ncbi:TPA: hypothetical protein N0F65_011785 [Lagenidium giganteum]|uniref:Uncharacterized protein n=1 Tax=Lagenidium giganteum TaxID=4803 RepID=A0AAV2YT17_9STRA|nr:TPA: hypothetical protein N0F65_011785 [Lagenidium giganteum]